jgi:twitching motility protein PilT
MSQENNLRLTNLSPLPDDSDKTVSSPIPAKNPLRLTQTIEEARSCAANLVTLDKLIGVALRGGASDLLLKVGQIPMFRFNGELYPLRDGPRIDANIITAMIAACANEAQIKKLEALEDIDTSYSSPLSGRVRVNIFRQRGEMGMVIRLIPSKVPSIDELNMQPIIKQIAECRRGLVLCTGATGSGKSTTLAAVIDHINRTRTAHIITIEDPIEYIHVDRRSMINQRELGGDTMSFSAALRSALRQAPDVILVGELRDTETIETALNAAETGHLVLSTLHTNDAADAMTRIMASMGSEKEAIVRTQLAENLRAVISQRLVLKKDRKSRCAAQEIMINTAIIRDRIVKGSPPNIVRDFISQGQNYGMQTFDQHLLHLCQSNIIDWEEGYANATNRDDFDLRRRGISVDQKA